jgi:hypothetical protein
MFSSTASAPRRQRPGNMKHDKKMESRSPRDEKTATSDQDSVKQKRKTVFIKLHPKPYAPRNSALLARPMKVD